MGYRNVTKEQLKYFMTDLKKLVKYESSPRESTEIHIQAGPTSINIQRLLEHTVSSKTKQKEKHKDESKTQKSGQLPPSVSHHKVRPEMTVNAEVHQRPRVKSAEIVRRPSKDVDEKLKLPTLESQTFHKKKQGSKPEQADKENVPIDNVKPPPVKSKMWIRPKSGSQVRKTAKKTDPVALYQAYQKDWEKFKGNICESSHSDLRWSIREKMMGNR